MPLSNESKQVLMDLAKAGVSADIINQLGQNLNQNQNADNILKGGVLRQQTFSSYMQNLDKKVDEKVKERLGQFAGIKDLLKTVKEGSDEYKKLIQTHDQLKTQLLNDNYNEDEINKLTLKTKEGLETLIKLADIEVPDNVKVDDTDIDLNLTGVRDMPNNNNNNKNQDYLRPDDPRLVETMSGLALGAVNIQGDIQANLYEYERLYGEKPSRDVVREFTNRAVQNFANGKKVDETADEILKLTEKSNAIALEQKNKELEQARKEGEAQAEKRLREAGINVDKVKAQQNGIGHKRHLSNIITNNRPNQSGDADDKLNSGRENNDNDKVSDGIINKFDDREFELPEAQRLRSRAADGRLPIERRPLTPLDGRPMRVQRALDYVSEKQIDLTAD